MSATAITASPARARPYVLLSPGPVNVSPAVRAAMSGPDLCHRQSEAFDLVDAVRALLHDVFALPPTWSSVLINGSGTAAVEAMVAQGVPAGKRLLVLQNGTYGARIAQMGRAHGIATRVMTSPNDAPVPLARLAAALAQLPDVGAVAMVHHETTTGLKCDVAAVASLCEARGAQLLVDSVSGLGAEALPFDAPALAMVAGSANKCIQGLPGAAFVLGRRRALLAAGRKTSVYLDLPTYLHKQDQRDTPFTLPLPSLMALRVALEELQTETVAGRARRYQAYADRLRAGLQGHGFRLALPQALRSCSVTSVFLPTLWSFAGVAHHLKRAGFIIYDGAPLHDRPTFRVANMGLLGMADLDTCTALLGALRQKQA